MFNEVAGLVTKGLEGGWLLRKKKNFFFQAEGGIRDLVRSRGLGNMYKRQVISHVKMGTGARGQHVGNQKKVDRTTHISGRLKQSDVKIRCVTLVRKYFNFLSRM